MNRGDACSERAEGAASELGELVSGAGRIMGRGLWGAVDLGSAGFYI